MGLKVRGEPLKHGIAIGVSPQRYLPALLILLNLASPSFVSASTKAECGVDHSSTAFELPKRLMSLWWNTFVAFRDNAGKFLKIIYWRVAEGRWGVEELVWVGALICVIQGLLLWRMRATAKKLDTGSRAQEDDNDRPSSLWKAWNIKPELEAKMSDPGLLQKYSTFETYRTSKATYPSIRTFFRPHPQADKLPNTPTPLPLLVFVHGLGGCVASFAPILTSLVNIAPCLGLDFPGCGRSAFSPKSWDAYTPDALAELLYVAVEQHISRQEHQGVVFIGHSMGCSLSLLAAMSLEENHIADVLSLIAICPQATPPSGNMATKYNRLLRIPTWIFDIMRTFDRRKGLSSPSVIQFTGKDADLELRRIQIKYNRQSRSPVFRRMAWGALAHSSRAKVPSQSLPGLDTWRRLKVPLFLIAGEGDTVTKPEEVAHIAQALGQARSSLTVADDQANTGQHRNPTDEDKPPNLANKRSSIVSKTEVMIMGGSQDSYSQAHTTNGSTSYPQKRRVLKTSILPYPASHTLLYDPSTYRTLAGLIQSFLSDHVDTRLSLGWQLQHLSTEGKWDVKNLAKWQAIEPVSAPIAGIFRAMKTLREIDDVHSPEAFVKQWKGKIKAVIDISHESPVYDPKGLDDGGIEYHKFPTVSKIPPTADETKEFIKLVDRLLDDQPEPPQEIPGLIGVHCHYGFNRTGYFICCYLIEKRKYGVQRAIDTFAEARPKGIKHAHFLDQLFVRYCVGLKRAPTIIFKHMSLEAIHSMLEMEYTLSVAAQAQEYDYQLNWMPNEVLKLFKEQQGTSSRFQE